MSDQKPTEPNDATFYLPLAWKDCYALRALLREHEDDPRIRAIRERLDTPLSGRFAENSS
jgi:hypothetical protein